MVLVSVGCSAESGGPDGPGTPTPEETPEPVTIDWLNQESLVRLEGGFSVKSCRGDAPLLCVRTGGEIVGIVELIEFPVSTIPELREPLAEGTLRKALTEFANSYYRDIAADRRAACPTGYSFETREPALVSIGGDPGIKMVFTGRLADGSPSEMTISHAAVKGESLFIVGAAAYDPGGCLGTEGSEFTTELLVDFEPALDAIVAGSPLPDPGSLLGQP